MSDGIVSFAIPEEVGGRASTAIAAWVGTYVAIKDASLHESMWSSDAACYKGLNPPSCFVVEAVRAPQFVFILCYFALRSFAVEQSHGSIHVYMGCYAFHVLAIVSLALRRA